MTTGGELLATEYRQRFGNGALNAIASINYSDAQSATDTQSSDRLRGHINATGVWHLDETYRTGFDLQRVSDQTYLLRYGFGVPLLNAMISRAYLQGFEPRAMTDVFAYAFQPLAAGSRQRHPADRASRRQPRPGSANPIRLGGRWFFNGNLLNIIRETGTQTRRSSLGSRWERIFRDGIGGQYAFSASLRGDAYSVSNLSRLSNPDLPSAYFPIGGAPAAEPIDRNFIAARVFPQLGVTWSYPLAHRGPERTAIVEPIVGAYVAPAGGNRRRIPNEDSLGFELRDVDLFKPDRLAGYDLLDTGQRVDYGLRLGLYDKIGGDYRLLIGQSYRVQPNPFLPPGSGAAQRLSDVVGRFVASPSSYLDLIYRFRLDKSNLSQQHAGDRAERGPAKPEVRRKLLFCAGAAARPDRIRPGHQPDDPLRQARAAVVQCQSTAYSLLGAGRQPDPQSDQLGEPDQWCAAVAIGRDQRVCDLGGDLSGRMHGVHRLDYPIGNPQWRRQARCFGHVQRRFQEPWGDRRKPAVLARGTPIRQTDRDAGCAEDFRGSVR